MRRLRKFARVLALFFPLLILGLRGHPYFHEVVLAFGLLFVLEQLTRLSAIRFAFGLPALLSIGGGMYLFGVDNSERLYPFIMSASMLNFFVISKDPADNPMIGPFKKKVMADPELLQILHKAKHIWVVGLSVNTAILGVFLFAFPLDSWILYAGFYSYLLLLSLFAASVLYVEFSRRVLRRRSLL